MERSQNTVHSALGTEGRPAFLRLCTCVLSAQTVCRRREWTLAGWFHVKLCAKCMLHSFVCVCQMQKTETLLFSGTHFLTRGYGAQQTLSSHVKQTLELRISTAAVLKFKYSAFAFCNIGRVSVLLRSPCIVCGRRFHFMLKLKQIFFFPPLHPNWPLPSTPIISPFDFDVTPPRHSQTLCFSSIPGLNYTTSPAVASYSWVSVQKSQ